MKKLILLIAVVSAGFSTSFAQNSPIRIGANVTYATENLNIGVGGNGVFSITEKIEIAAAYTHFFGEKVITHSADFKYNYNILDVDGRYIFVDASDLKFYGTTGLGVLWSKAEIKNIKSTSENNFGFNIGAGMSYPVFGNFVLNPEAKFTLVNDNTIFRIGIALQYNF